MAIGLTNFQPLSWEQNNPVLTGYEHGTKAITNTIKNAYLPQTLQAKLLAQQLMNQIQQPRANMAQQFTDTQLSQAQQNALATHIQNQTNKFKLDNPAFLDLEAAAATHRLHQGQGQDQGGNGGVGNSEQTALANLTPGMQPGESRQLTAQDFLNAGGQGGQDGQGGGQGGQGDQDNSSPVTQNGYPQSNAKMPDYNFGLPNFNYDNDPMANNVLMNKFGIPEPSKTQLKMQLDNYNNDFIANKQLAAGAYQTQQDLGELMGAYDNAKWFEKGFFGGKTPAITANAQLIDAAKNKLVQDLAGVFQQGHITNNALDTVAASKILRSHNPDAVEGLAGGIQALTERSQEWTNFERKAYSMKIPYEKTLSLWNRYQNQRPLYNSTDNITNQKFRNTSDDYLTPEAVNNPDKYTPSNQKELEKNTVTQKEIDDYAKTNGLSSSAVRRHLREQRLI